MPPSERIPISVVPPPISTIIEPAASSIGKPAPKAAAIGSSIKCTLAAPAANAESKIALRSTWVEPPGTQITTRGGTKDRPSVAFLINIPSIRSVITKSAITPSLIGRTISILRGARPCIFFASVPTAMILLLLPAPD